MFKKKNGTGQPASSIIGGTDPSSQPIFIWLASPT